MPNITAVRFIEDDLDLARITELVQAGEEDVGPLLAISACEHFPPRRLTCFTHEDKETPAGVLELRLCSGGAVPKVPGKTLLCIGRCFVAGSKQTVAAFR